MTFTSLLRSLRRGMLGHMDVLELYRAQDGYLEGHFLLASGRHSPFFLQSMAVLQHPQHNDLLGAALAELYRDDGLIDFVIGPEMGGVTLAYTVARALGVRALFAEKDHQGGMFVRDGLVVNQGERFIAVEDVLTTGGSVLKTAQAAKARGAVCLGIACIIDRGLAKLPPELPLRSLTKLDFPTYSAEQCPLCQQGVVLQEV